MRAGPVRPAEWFGSSEEGERPEPSVVFRAGSGSECEAVYASWVCPNDYTKIERRCKCKDERRCPVCVHQWAWGDGVRAALRVDALSRRAGNGSLPRHFVVSLRGAKVARTRREYNDAFAPAWDVLRLLGARGACLVYHAWRHRSRAGVVEWYESPHVHAMVRGPVNTWRLADGEVIVKNVDDGEEERETLRGTLKYLLDHCAVVDRSPTLRWYGSMSVHAVKDGDLGLPRATKAPLCPICGCIMERAEYGLDAIKKVGLRLSRSSEEDG